MIYSTSHPPPIVYAVCGTSRGGSEYLCRQLAAAGVLGRPRDYLKVGSMPRWRAYLGLPVETSLTRYVDRLLQIYAAGGVFGISTAAETLDRLETVLRPTHFIWIRRRDVLCQAARLYRVCQGGGADRPPRHVPLDRKTIARIGGWIDAANEHWARRFAADRRPCLPLWHDQVSAHPEAAVAQVARFLDQRLPEGAVAHLAARTAEDVHPRRWAA